VPPELVELCTACVHDATRAAELAGSGRVDGGMRTVRLIAIAMLAAACVAAAPASAAVAPGRMAFPLGPTGLHDGVDPHGLSIGVASPTGA